MDPPACQSTAPCSGHRGVTLTISDPSRFIVRICIGALVPWRTSLTYRMRSPLGDQEMKTS